MTTLLQVAPALLRRQHGRFGLEPGEFLPAGQEIESPDGHYVLRMERSGNLVLRDNGVITWSSGTTTPNSILVIDDDGTMVVQAPDGTSTWSSATHSIGPAAEPHNGNRLQVHDTVHIIRNVLLGPAT